MDDENLSDIDRAELADLAQHKAVYHELSGLLEKARMGIIVLKKVRYEPTGVLINYVWAHVNS